MKAWSRVAGGALGFLLIGCGDGAKIVQMTQNGGVVVYPFRGDNQLVTSFRREAIELIEKQCGGNYAIVREGEAKGRSRVAGPVAGAEEVIRERRWGIEFRCK